MYTLIVLDNWKHYFWNYKIKSYRLCSLKYLDSVLRLTCKCAALAASVHWTERRGDWVLDTLATCCLPGNPSTWDTSSSRKINSGSSQVQNTSAEPYPVNCLFRFIFQLLLSISHLKSKQGFFKWSKWLAIMASVCTFTNVYLSIDYFHMGLEARNPVFRVCKQQRCRTACTFLSLINPLVIHIFWKYHI